MSDIEECRQAVMTAYLWIVRMKSTDPKKQDAIMDLQGNMETVWMQFQSMFP